MRPPAPTLPTKYRYPTVIVTVGLFSGILITALIWLKLPNQLITPLFWISLGLIGLGSFMYIRKLVDPRLRWIMVLAVFAAVSLVYLFPELFSPACGGMPRAFALSCPKDCQVKECTKWVAGPSPQCPNPGPGGGCCLSYETVCDPNCEPPPPPDQPPSISKSLICTNWGQNSWCIGSLTLQLTATEPQGKQVQISGDIAGTPFACPAGVGSVNCSVPLPEGAGTANYLATSITGLTASGSTTYKHDSRLPQINGWLNGTSGDNSWYVSSVDVNASASDPLPGSGLAAFVYNLDAGGWKNYSGPLSLPDGVHSLSLRASDAAGNVVETNQTIQVDTVTPALDLSVTGTAGTNGWYRSNVQVSAAVVDSGSGVSAFEYDLDGAGWTAYTTPLELSDGVHSLSLRALDVAGNSTNWTQSFRLDTINPLLDMTVDGILGTSGWYTSLVEISLVASDPGSPPLETSGLGALEYNLNGAGWAGYSVPLELSDGVYTLELRAIDDAGNVTSGTQGFQVDAAPPTLDVNVSGTQGASPWYVSIVQVEAVAGDATSNLSTLEVKVDGGDWSAYNAPLAFGDGPHSYRFRARDNAGNLTLTSLQSLLVDTIPPALSLPESWEVGEKAYFELQDNGSGLASVRLVIEDEDERYPKVTWEDALASYKFNGEINWDGRFKDGSLAPPTGEYYATLKVTDNAGNENRIAGQINIPLVSFIETLINPLGGLVSGTEGTDPVVTLIPDSETEAELTSQSPGESAPSTLSFGGGNNNAESSGEQTALKLGGGNNGAVQPSGAQTGKVSFNAGGQSNSPLSNAPSNLLWGATATAAIGAFAAEILRKKQEEEAKAAEKAARQESRAESTYRQKIKANKLAKLETKWAAEREQAEQLQLAEQRKQTAINPRLTRKEEKVEAEMRAYGNKPAPSTAPKQTYIVPDMSWKKGDYAQLEHAQEVAEEASMVIAAKPTISQQEKLQQPKTWLDKTFDWVEKHQKETSIGVGIGVGLLTIGVVLAAAATAVVTLPVLLVAAGAAAVVAGAEIAIGTALLNNHFGRDLTSNIWSNIGAAAISATLTAGLGLFVFGGGLTSALIAGGNVAGALCLQHQTVCNYVEPLMKGLDIAEEVGLMMKGGIQTARGDIAGAIETAHELQMEYMDGGIPGNAVAKEIGEELSGLITKYGDEILDLVNFYGDDAVHLIKVYGTDGIKWIHKYGKNARLKPLLDDDLFQDALEQGSDALEALAHWTDDELLKHGDELVSRASRDAKAIKAASELSKLKNVDSPEARKLIETIAENSIMGNGDRLVLGKWVPEKGLDGGFMGTARAENGLFYGTNPGLQKALEDLPIPDQEKLFWAVNEQVLQTAVDSKWKIDYSFNGFDQKELDKEIQAIHAIATGQSREEVARILGKFPFRMREVEFLVKQGYKYEVDLVTQAVHFTKP